MIGAPAGRVVRGLACIALAACSSQPATSLGMAFARDAFYDAPFPSDDLRRADGHIDLAKLSGPDPLTWMQQIFAVLAGADGFAQTGAIYFRASSPLDGGSLPDVAASTQPGASVFLVSVDPSRDDFLRRRPIDVAFLDDGGPFGAPNLLALLPLQGAPLGAGESYAAVVTTGVRDRAAHPIVPSPELTALVAGRAPRGLSGGALAGYRNALATLTSHGIEARTIAGLAVFTTEHATAALATVRDAALAQPLPQISLPVLGDVYDDYCVFDAQVDMPVYQSGTPPYTLEGGAWTFDGDRPVVDHTETARVVFTIPRTHTPAGGWPLVVFVRTGAGGDRPLTDRGASGTPGSIVPIVAGSGPARDFAQIGFAGAMVEGPLDGRRNPGGGNEDFVIFNVENPAALRDNIRQSAVELAVFRHVVGNVSFDPGGCVEATHVTFDASHIAVMGHSMGAWIAPLTLAVEPSYGTAVLSGAGGSFIANVLDKQLPARVRPFLSLLLRGGDANPLEAHDPGLTLLQWAGEPADPQIYAPAIAHAPAGRSPGHSVLMLQGIVDHYILPSIANALSLALGLDEAGPSYDASNAELQGLGQTPLEAVLPLVGRSRIALPATANIDARTTAVVVQHPGDRILDGHEVVFQSELARHQIRCFLASWLTGPPVVPPDGAVSDPCGAHP
jgi:hypothetical protein